MTVFLEFNHSLRLGLGVNLLIIIWSLVFDEPLFQILAIMIMKVQQTFMSSKSGFAFWRVLEINGLDLVSLALENMSFKSFFGLWRMLEAPDLGFAS